MREIIIKAPAKVNLFLKVLRKRPDGYHDIETIFEKVALFDTIRMKRAKTGIKVRSDYPGLPKGKENLVYQAAQMMQEACGKPLAVEIELEKKIPVCAGLGGGSSDAASVLLGLKKLFGLRIPEEKMRALARKIGADVPFFLSKSAWAVGRHIGDRLEKIKTDMKLWHLFVVPPFSVSSKEAYEWRDKAGKVLRSLWRSRWSRHYARSGSTLLRKVGEKADISDALDAIRKDDAHSLGRSLYNDLQGLSLARSGLFGEFKELLLDNGACGALISGSGPVLFGIYKEEREVVRSQEKIERLIAEKGKTWQVLTAATHNSNEAVTSRTK